MKKKKQKTLEMLKKTGVSVNVGGNNFETIELLKVLLKTMNNPNDRKEVEDAITKLRESPEFKENEVKKKLERIKEDF